MEECVTIVDNSNIWIEKIKLYAKIKGRAIGPEGKTPCYYTWSSQL